MSLLKIPLSRINALVNAHQRNTWPQSYNFMSVCQITCTSSMSSLLQSPNRWHANSSSETTTTTFVGRVTYIMRFLLSCI